MRERFRGSIPRQTMLDVLRKQGKASIGFGNGSLGNLVDVGRLPSTKTSWQRRPETTPRSFNVKDHVFSRPTPEKPPRSLIPQEDGRIGWLVEAHEGLKVHEDSNGAGNLGIIIQFSGIRFEDPTVFHKSRLNFGADNKVFYTHVGYKKDGEAFLILGTFGDIFEAQVVAKKKDTNPFFQEETRVPGLMTVYDPESMEPIYNNGVVIVAYTLVEWR